LGFIVMADEVSDGLGPAPNVETSGFTDLGQRWRGIVPPPSLTGGICGDMWVAIAKASPRMAWISLAKSTIDDAMQWGSIASLVGILPNPWPREARREWPIALARKVAA
jgi:hypothetical protein